MRIREATAADARSIAEVHVASWRTSYRGIVPDEYLASLSVAARERSWRQQLRQAGDATRQTFAYVAEEEGQTTAGAGNSEAGNSEAGNETGRIVGFAAGGPNLGTDTTYAGELYAIYLLREAQGHGLGRQLVRTVAERLVREGMRSMLIWVLEANAPARGFYEALGGVLLPQRQDFERAGIRLAEVAYGWADTGAFVMGS